jgi:hypothetical protein
MWREIYHEFPRWAKVSVRVKVAFTKAGLRGNRRGFGGWKTHAGRRNHLGHSNYSRTELKKGKGERRRVGNSGADDRT